MVTFLRQQTPLVVVAYSH
uniref:Uncharacterized protein n=1 Tax=Oryza meridionalis TaxID=40149 RepID=A0A0E0D6U4_9ORYZ